MKRRMVSAMTLMLLTTSMLMLAFHVQPIRAQGAIYIRADGSIDPPTAQISTVDNVTYTFADDINDSIVVERDDIVVDGAGYALQGTGTGIGIIISEESNITIRNANVRTFDLGIDLNATSNNLIYDNNLKDNRFGIHLLLADNNTLTENNVVDNDQGIILYMSRDNVISENTVSGNWDHSIYLDMSFSNKIYHNTFLDNGSPYIYQSNNIWDNDYPSGGNYWSDFNGTDYYCGRYQNETGSDGIGDTPYVIDANNIDHYPLMNRWSVLPVGGELVPISKLQILAPWTCWALSATVISVAFVFVKRTRKNGIRLSLFWCPLF